MPDAYFDLEFVDGTAVDGKGNATVTVVGGQVTETVVEHDGAEKTATAFTRNDNEDYYYNEKEEESTITGALGDGDDDSWTTNKK